MQYQLSNLVGISWPKTGAAQLGLQGKGRVDKKSCSTSVYKIWFQLSGIIPLALATL